MKLMEIVSFTADLLLILAVAIFLIGMVVTKKEESSQGEKKPYEPPFIEFEKTDEKLLDTLTDVQVVLVDEVIFLQNKLDEMTSEEYGSSQGRELEKKYGNYANAQDLLSAAIVYLKEGAGNASTST